jgi:DNA repair protein RadC
MATSTIQVELSTKGRLDKLKVHPRESYDEVITRMANRIALQDEAAKNMKGMKKL